MPELLSVFLRGKLILLAEAFVKILGVRKTAADTDIKQGKIGQEQKPSGKIECQVPLNLWCFEAADSKGSTETGKEG